MTMDQDLDLTPIPPIEQKEPQVPQLNTDEIFNKLLEEKQLNWTDVMSEIVEWATLKFVDEEEVNLSEKFQSFNSFISSYYTDKIK